MIPVPAVITTPDTSERPSASLVWLEIANRSSGVKAGPSTLANRRSSGPYDSARPPATPKKPPDGTPPPRGLGDEPPSRKGRAGWDSIDRQSPAERPLPSFPGRPHPDLRRPYRPALAAPDRQHGR